MTWSEREARAGISLLCLPGSAKVGRLVAREGPAGALECLDIELAKEGQRAPTRTEAAQVLERAGAAGIRLIIPSDPEWPAGLGSLERESFRELRGVAGCLSLWVSSQAPLAELVQRSVGVVGTRTPTGTGVHVATELGQGLADAGWATVSGAAYGIDTAAHRGSLVGGGATVAVLAGGTDVRYPAGNEGMLDRISREGAIVSEVPPGKAPTRSRFLVRNRLIAAMTPGTVLVEAGLRSGARNTMAHARAMSRILMSVPGQVTSPLSIGSNLELRREAVAVMSAADVLESVAAVGEHLQPGPSTVGGIRDGLSRFDAEVLDAVPVRSARSTSSIARTAGNKPVVAVGITLARLESVGLVRRNDTGFVLTELGRAPVASGPPALGADGQGLLDVRL